MSLDLTNVLKDVVVDRVNGDGEEMLEITMSSLSFDDQRTADNYFNSEMVIDTLALIILQEDNNNENY